MQSQLTPLEVRASNRGHLLTVRVSGNGFNGVGHLDFTLRDDKIAHLVIE